MSNLNLDSMDRTSRKSRRSTRRSLRTANANHRSHAHFWSLEQPWRRHYLDLGHCRLKKCTERVRNAKDAEVEHLRDEIGKSFLATAISAASAYGASKETDLIAYANAVMDRGLDPNDVHGHHHPLSFDGNSAVALAAYHGYPRLLATLLDAGCSLESAGDCGDALCAAVRNGKHLCLELLLRQGRASAIIGHDIDSKPRSSALNVGFRRRDARSVHLLKEIGSVSLSDEDMKSFSSHQMEKKCIEPVLKQLYPTIQNVMHWRRDLHWSFPRMDRQVLNTLWYALSKPSASSVLPKDLWLLAFSFVGRGWFSKPTKGI